MSLKRRNTQIKKLKKKGLTLKEIGLKYNLTSERVRQVIYNQHRLKKDDSSVWLNKYIKKLERITSDHLLKEIDRLSKYNRTKEIVLQRKHLIKLLKNKYKFSYHKIGFLLQRDHSSIINLYKS